MKTKLFIAVLFMTVLFGCSKDDASNNLIIGKWFECYTEYKEDGHFDSRTYNEETTGVFYTFHKNGNLTIYYVEEEREETATWKIKNETLSIEFHFGSATEMVTYALEFENDDRMNLTFYYNEFGDKSEYEMSVFQRI